MGCLKLTYRSEFSTLKVVHRDAEILAKSCAGYYRYGFNGQEKDDEIKGDGNSLNFKYRMHDPRIGRFFAVDPLAPKYPELSVYQFAGNTPIWARELEGLESWYTTSESTEPGNDGQGGPRNSSGPFSDGYAEEQGYSEYGVGETTEDYNFTDQEITDFSNWNSTNGPSEPGACLGCATTGSEMLTGGDGGFRNSSGNNVLTNKTVYDLGENLELGNNATEINTPIDNETQTMLDNPNAASVENAVYLLGPAGAYHSILVVQEKGTGTFSIYDQGTGWDVKGADQYDAQQEISQINSFHLDWGTRMWQLSKSTTTEVRIPLRP